MEKANPFFSIIIPSYNRAGLIGRTIESALKQSFKDFEIIVVDDGSTDDTETFIRDKYPEQLSYYKKENEERGKARNYGAQKASGKYLYFLDSDDLLYENHLQIAYDFIAENSPEVFFQQYEFVNENQKTRANYQPKSSPINRELIAEGNFMSCHGVFILRQVFLENPFHENRELSGSEDYELWLRLAASYPIHFSNQVTSALCMHSQRSVLNFDAQTLIKRKELMLDLIKNNRAFQEKYSELMNKIEVNAYSYISLHLALIKNRKAAFTYLLKSLSKSPGFIFEKRFWAILKHLI